MEVIFTPGTGVEAHQKTVMACRVPPDLTGRQADGVIEGQEGGPLTVDMLALAAWLAQAGMPPVAMDRTGEEWNPGDNIWDGESTLFLGNAAHVQQVPGHQTDNADARWLAQRLRHGLRQASVIPPVEPRELTRSRAMNHLTRWGPMTSMPTGVHTLWTVSRGGLSGWAIVSASTRFQLRSRLFSR